LQGITVFSKEFTEQRERFSEPAMAPIPRA
jgi:hypothetical protein